MDMVGRGLNNGVSTREVRSAIVIPNENEKYSNDTRFGVYLSRKLSIITG